MKRTWSLISWTVISSGCALLSKNEPTMPRYFTPVLAARAIGSDKPVTTALELRLGAVTAGAEVRESLAIRSSNHELTYDRDNRWTEKPEAYLKRALLCTLFEQRGVRRIVSGIGATLDVELVAFEEVQDPPSVRASVVVVLRGERFVLLEKSVIVERPVGKGLGGGADPEASVSALSLALTDVVEQIADEVTVRLKEVEKPDPKDTHPKRPGRPAEPIPDRIDSPELQSQSERDATQSPW